MPSKRAQIAALMEGHPYLEAKFWPKGTYSGYKSQYWEFREITTRRTKAAYSSPDRALAYARGLIEALPKDNDGVPF
jgi:hypothetical protein